MVNDELSESVKRCLDILQENVEILADIELDLESEKEEEEDELTPNMELYQLYDLTEDVAAESARLRRAESNLVRRQAEDSF